MTDTTLDPSKVKALELATVAGGPHDEVVKRAHAYHGFLKGTAAATAPAGAANKGAAADPKAGAGTTAGKSAPAGTTAGKSAPAGTTAGKGAPAGTTAGKGATADPKAGAGKTNGTTAPKGAANPPSAQSVPADTKAPGGKHTYADVVAMLHKVQNSPAGRPECFKILLEDGGAAKSVRDLKPAFYDAVVEACQNVISDEGEPAGAAADESDPLGDLGDVAGGGEQPDMGV